MDWQLEEGDFEVALPEVDSGGRVCGDVVLRCGAQVSHRRV